MAPGHHPPSPRCGGALPYAGAVSDRPPGFQLCPPQVYCQPMVTYHICRVCARPRSDRYHREHPIPSKTLPPPPGICRRCRVTGDETAEDSDNSDLLLSHARIGIECLVPESAVVTYEQTKNDKGRVYREVEVKKDRTARSRTRVVYRYVMPDATPKCHTKQDIPSVDAVTNLATAKAVVQAEIQPNAEVAVVRQPASKTASGHKPKTRYGFTESEIRWFARDEVERYRQAERLIEDHPTPYAHGKLAPAQRPSHRLSSKAVDDLPSLPQAPPPIIEQIKLKPQSSPSKGQFLSRSSGNSKSHGKVNETRSQVKDTTTKAITPKTVDHRHRHEYKVSYGRADESPRCSDGVTRPTQRRLSEIVMLDTSYEARGRPVEVETVLASPLATVSETQQERHGLCADPHSKDASSLSKTSRSIIAGSTELDVLIDGGSSTIVLARISGPPIINSHRHYHPSARSQSGWTIDSQQGSVTPTLPPAEQSQYRHSVAHDQDSIQTYHSKQTASRPRRLKSSSERIDSRQESFRRADVDQHTPHALEDGDKAPMPASNDARLGTVPRKQSVSSLVGVSSKASDWTDREYWEDDCVIQTASHRSTTRPVDSSHKIVTYEPREQDERHSTAVVKEHIIEDHPRAASTRIIGSMSYGSKASEPRSGASYHTASRHEQKPTRSKLEPSSGTTATYDYEYRQRRVQPASGLVDMEFFEKSPPDVVHESEELFRYRPSRTSAKATPVSPNDILKIPEAVSEHMSTTTSKSGPRQTQVHFSNDVAISPTPPGSDEYPPSFVKSGDRSIRGLHENLAKIRARSSRRETSVPSQDDRGRRSTSNSQNESRYGSDATCWPEADAVPPATNKNLERAYSESPSREKHITKHGEPQSDRSSRRHRPERRRQDPHGPYVRLVPRSASMEVACGSAHTCPVPSSVREI